MKRKRTTPLREESLSSGYCSPELRTRILGTARYFRGLPAPALAAVSTRFRALHHPAKAVICREGEPAERLFFVVHGKVKLLQHGSSGDEVLFDILPQGALFGGLAPLGRRRYLETAIAQTDSCVLAITAETFQRLLRDHSEVALEVLQNVARDLDDAREVIRQLSTVPVEARIATALLKLADRLGEASGDGLLIQSPLPRQDIAAMVGATTETVSRVISGFKRAGYIDTGRQWVRIRDHGGLEGLIAGT